MKTTHEKTREFARILEEEVKKSYVSSGFHFKATPEADTDVAVSIMDCNESLSQLDYPGYVKQMARNIDGSVLFEFVTEDIEE